MSTAPSKLFTFRETVSFEVPDDWIETYEDGERCTFHEQETGVARLKLRIGQYEATDCSLEDLIDSLFFGEPCEQLAENARLRFQVEPDREEGREVFAYSWTVAVPIHNCQVRTAEFSCSVPAGREGDPEVLAEIDRVDRMIRAARFPPAGSRL